MFVFVIKKYLEERNISVEEISSFTNMSREYILKLINNEVHDTHLSILYKISKALDIELSKLYYSTEDAEYLRERLNWRVKKYGISDDEVKEIVEILNIFQNIELKNNITKL